MWVMKYDKDQALRSSVKLDMTGGTDQFYTLRGREFLKYQKWSEDEIFLKYEKYSDDNIFLTLGHADGPFFRVVKKTEGKNNYSLNKIKQFQIENGFLTQF